MFLRMHGNRTPCIDYSISRGPALEAAKEENSAIVENTSGKEFGFSPAERHPAGWVSTQVN
jgi:hypothetical protein